MHKITKGLKKKKKGKKSKHKEDDLFKPEELEAYRREHQAALAEASNTAEENTGQKGQNEEWRKFLALTSDVDDILKKTQGDLDRIKSTSFFKRVPPPSEVKQKEEEVQKLEQAKQEQEDEARRQKEEEEKEINLGLIEVSESESEEEEDDDIFDTAYIEAVATQLAYIPESPTDQTEGDDPFDTSYADRAILGPATERKGKKLVPLGAAVEVLTGRVQLPTCATQRPTSSRRQVYKERDLLLGSFDDNANSIPAEAAAGSPVEVKKTLLDDDSIPLPDEPIDLSKNIIPPAPVRTDQSDSRKPSLDKTKDIVEQFDIITKKEEESDDDKEFEALAAESLNKTATVVTTLPTAAPQVLDSNIGWDAFGEKKQKHNDDEDAAEELTDDPFDTTFAENILPGKAELKQIEKEILESDFEFPVKNSAPNKVSINITYPSGQKEVVSYSERVSEQELNSIKPIHRDLLGGSNTDLSNLGSSPLQPTEKVDENYIEYCDPFDTSIVETVKQPGQAELKFIEKELLGDIKPQKGSLSDDEFDPRAEEEKCRVRTASRPDVLNINPTKTVSFDLPSPQKDLIGADEHKVIKPLTPFYVRKNSVPEEKIPDDLEDPFDTSFVAGNIAPGKAELKIIESELFDATLDKKLSIEDNSFDPRDEKTVKVAKVVEDIKNIQNPPKPKIEPVDLLSVSNDISVKVLTPAAEVPPSLEELSYSDPFDTSIASNILPGKTELKLLETELIHTTIVPEDPDFDPRKIEKPDLLSTSTDNIVAKPLTPILGAKAPSEDIVDEDIDPFDTSFASNLQPGKAELKFLESELM